MPHLSATSCGIVTRFAPESSTISCVCLPSITTDTISDPPPTRRSGISSDSTVSSSDLSRLSNWRKFLRFSQFERLAAGRIPLLQRLLGLVRRGQLGVLLRQTVGRGPHVEDGLDERFARFIGCGASRLDRFVLLLQGAPQQFDLAAIGVDGADQFVVGRRIAGARLASCAFRLTSRAIKPAICCLRSEACFSCWTSAASAVFRFFRRSMMSRSILLNFDSSTRTRPVLLIAQSELLQGRPSGFFRRRFRTLAGIFFGRGLGRQEIAVGRAEFVDRHRNDRAVGLSEPDLGTLDIDQFRAHDVVAVTAGPGPQVECGVGERGQPQQ